MAAEKDYVLGTHDVEIERLGVQHRVWRERVLACWREAGIGAGSRVLDVGAGPGYATVDLAELVGASGEVIGVERSRRFIEAAEAALAARGFGHARILERDLMRDELGISGMDAAWCRWVASFVLDPAKLISVMAGALRRGGKAIFHEYVDYRTFQLIPRRPAMESFVKEVMASWRDNGGEPDIALRFPKLLPAAGLRIVRTTPVCFAARPGDFAWQWPQSFITTHPRRLVELGRVDAAWEERVLKEFYEAKGDANSVLITPMVLEVVADKV